MKIKRLIIHNIASYENADINFDAAPLNNADVFLISGATGSGKSTILDAICIALFGKTPRIDESDTTQVLNKHEGMTLTDPRRLLRRNTGEGYVELYFEASGIEFLAHWGVRCAYNKPNRPLQPREWWLKETVSGNVLTIESKIKERIDELVGLDYDQFCRTTMLSQGEFDKFLKSKESEKAEILQKITRDDTYQRIGQKIFAVTADHKNRYLKLKEKLENAKVLSDEEIAQLRQQIADMAAEIDKFNKQIADHGKTRSWLDMRNKMTKNVDDLTNALNAAIAETDNDHYRASKTNIAQYDSTGDARTALRQINEQRASIANANKAKEQLRDKYAALLADVANLDKRANEAKEKLDSTQAIIDSENDRKPIYDVSGEICTSLQSALDSDKKAKDARKQLKKLDQDAQRSKDNLTKLHQSQVESSNNLEQMQKTLNEMQAKLDACNISALHADKDKQQQLLGSIDNAVSMIKLHDTNQKAFNKNVDDIATAQNKAAELVKSLALATQTLETKKAVLSAAEDVRDKQRAAAGESAAVLRSALKPGDKCPVCGQLINDVLPVADLLEELLETADKAYRQASDDFMAANSAVQRIEAETKANDTAIAKAKEQSVALKNAADQSLADVEKACLACSRKFAGVDQTIGELVALKVTVNDQFLALKKQIADVDEAQNNLNRYRVEVDSAKKACDSLTNSITEVRLSMQKIDGDIEKAKSLIGQFDAAATEARNKALSLLGTMIAWDNDPISATALFIKELTDKKNAYTQLSISIISIRETLQRETMLAEAAHNAVRRVSSSVVEWGDIQPTQALNVDDVAEALNAVAADVKSSADTILTATEKISAAQAQLDNFVASHPEIDVERLKYLASLSDADMQSLRDKLKQLDEKVTVQRGALLQAQEQLELHTFTPPVAVVESPDITIAKVDEAIESLQKSRDELAQRSGGISQQLAANSEELIKLQADKQDCDKAEKIYLQWKSLNDMFGDSEGKKFRTIALSYVLNSLIRSANVYMSRLTDRYRLSVQPGTFIILVEDAYQGYTKRTSNTISGGETFLVSLALALALSDLGSMRGIDVLFIDEGFGSLSGEPLQKAIETLRILHSNDRRVGIISHVAELRERIPVQIQVAQTDRSAASSVTILG